MDKKSGVQYLFLVYIFFMLGAGLFLFIRCEEADYPLSPDLLEEIKILPTGDNMNYQIYPFFQESFVDHSKETEKEAQALIKSEMEIKQENLKNPGSLKPHAANVVEYWLSHVLDDLCHQHPYCIQAGLYSKNTIAFALTEDDGMEIPGILDEHLRKHMGSHYKEGPLIENSMAKKSKNLLHINYAVCLISKDYISICDKNSKASDIIGYIRYTVDLKRNAAKGRRH